MATAFKDLTEREILALAISLEEEDARIYADIADGLRAEYPATASIFEEMRAEEETHRARLIELYRQRFGEHIPLIRRQDVKGFVDRPAVWRLRPLRLEAVRRLAELMEVETRRFYERAAARVTDASTRQLLDDLAAAERENVRAAESIRREAITPAIEAAEAETRRRLFVLQIVQPGLAGLMDGSVSTLAPLFAAALATHSTHDAFLVGLAASVGAGISMGFAEALSDDGSLTGRGRPSLRGLVRGRRHRPYAAVPHPQLPSGAGAGDHRRPAGAGGHQLHPVPLHGHAAGFGGAAGDGRRTLCLPGRHPDRQLLSHRQLLSPANCGGFAGGLVLAGWRRRPLPPRQHLHEPPLYAPGVRSKLALAAAGNAARRAGGGNLPWASC